MDLRRGINLAVDSVLAHLDRITTKITDQTAVEQVKYICNEENGKLTTKQVATISANNDVEIGKLIAAAMEKVGKEGVITVKDGKTLENVVEVTKVHVRPRDDLSILHYGQKGTKVQVPGSSYPSRGRKVVQHSSGGRAFEAFGKHSQG